MTRDSPGVTVPLPAAGFAYLPGPGRVFSRGVIADEGSVFHRVQLQQPLPLSSGLRFASEYLGAIGRPQDALCGCELRIPCRLTRTGFHDFNRRYIAELQRHGFVTDPVNPAARTNVAGAAGASQDPALAAFTFARPGRRSGAGRDFLISGTPEIAIDPERVVAAGDASFSAARVKCAFVLAGLQHVVHQLGGAWSDITAAQVYTRRSPSDFGETLASFGLVPALCAHFDADPPVLGPGDVPLEFEADVRSITIEEIV